MNKSSVKSIVKDSLILVSKFIEHQPHRGNDAIVTLYHELGRGDSGFCVDEAVFEEQLVYLSKQNVQWTTATELAEKLTLLDNSSFTCLTFDDGRLSAYRASLHLAERGIKSTHFIIPDRVNTNAPETVNWKQVRELDSQGIEIGSHSLSHPYLTQLSDLELDREMSESKKTIEDELGKVVTAIAYPYGDFNHRVVEAAKSNGYKCGYTTQHLYTSPIDDVFRIPRFEPVVSVDQVVDLYEGRGHLFYRCLGWFLNSNYRVQRLFYRR